MYAATPEASFAVTREGDKLSAQLAGQEAAEVLVLHETVFYFPGDVSDLVFVKVANGKAMQLLYHFGDQDSNYERIQ